MAGRLDSRRFCRIIRPAENMATGSSYHVADDATLGARLVEKYPNVAHRKCEFLSQYFLQKTIDNLNLLDSKGNYTATSNNTKLVHWLVQRGGAWVGCGSASPPPSLYRK